MSYQMLFHVRKVGDLRNLRSDGERLTILLRLYRINPNYLYNILNMIDYIKHLYRTDRSGGHPWTRGPRL
jgi:hypothetical protein